MHRFDLPTIALGLPARTLIDSVTAASEGKFPRLVIDAPPGTGKTTIVPPLIAEVIAGGSTAPQRVIVTQPRRMAARAAARRLAQLSGTRLGEEVGFTVRGERQVSAATRVEFVTTGVLVRRILGDPALSGVAAIILDEVHERQLETDLAFAMARELLELREDLAVVAMSATLDAQLWAQRLGAQLLSVSADIHPLEVRWAPTASRPLDARGVTRDFLDHAARTTVRALGENSHGDVLVFAPGVREIEEIAARIRSLSAGWGSAETPLEVHTLTGRTPSQEQDSILRPRNEPAARDGQGGKSRRVIVSSSVAESALTVPGVRIVIDSGLSRRPMLDTRRQMSGLVTVRESKASGIQRSGRAARLGPGTVYRLMSETDWAGLPEHTTPEIASSDLTSAVLDVAVWGGDPGMLPEPFPTGPARMAVENLVALGALEFDEEVAQESGDRSSVGPEPGVGPYSVTDLGRRIAQIPASPWAARGLIDGAAMVGAKAAAEAIACIESDRRTPSADLVSLLKDLRRRGERSFQQNVSRFARMAADSEAGGAAGSLGLRPEELGLIVALSFPRQIARLRSNADSEYLLASGTAATLPSGSSLAGSEWLAVSEVGLHNGRGMIRAAAVIDQDTAELAGAALLTTTDSARFESGRTRAVRRQHLGAIELTSTPIAATLELARAAVADSVRERGAREVLAPRPEFESLRRRLGLLHSVFGAPWPDVSWSHLAETLSEWCPAALDRIAQGASPRSIDLSSALRTLLPWPEASELEELVPDRIEVPSGSQIRLEYPDPDEHDPESTGIGPVLAVKLQECFGWSQVPTICHGRVPIVIHLLSPARRPLAVTSDLASFWANAYAQVRAENRGRYPKHEWPEDPLSAKPNKGTKRSGTMKR